MIEVSYQYLQLKLLQETPIWTLVALRVVTLTQTLHFWCFK